MWADPVKKSTPLEFSGGKIPGGWNLGEVIDDTTSFRDCGWVVGDMVTKVRMEVESARND
jgi:hypothetical protein